MASPSSPDLVHEAELTHHAVLDTLKEGLQGMDDGELFVEQHLSESLVWDDRRLRQSSYNRAKGFGMRAVLGEATAYAHSSWLSEESLKAAARHMQALKAGHVGISAIAPHAAFGDGSAVNPLYASESPMDGQGFLEKIQLLQAIDHYLRGKDNRVRQVSASLHAELQHVQILRPDGQDQRDSRPLVRLSIQVVVEQDGRMERGSSGAGGRYALGRLMDGSAWQAMADEALRQALVNLEARPAPAGEMPVVLGPGWPGVLLHEAVGHGLEGDFNRKETSAFSKLMGQQVAVRGVTIVDDGTLPERRGSLTIDDEGTPSGYNVLIEDGILKGYMQDRLNARLMGVSPTGNGRRESYARPPMPRMTNTYMLGGETPQSEMIASVKRGIFAPHFGGGQVDITSGKFVFSASEAYLIEDGRITSPIKGATIIGHGPQAMKNVKFIGNDLELDPGIGTCGKGGQSVPVGIGQPSLRIDGLTVGGTQV